MTGSRRSLLRGAAGLVTGGVLGSLPGTAAGVASGAAPSREAKGETAVTATIDPSVHGAVGVPPGVEQSMRELRSRYPSIDPTRFGALSAEVRLDGDRVVGGAAVADGAFDTAALRDELVTDGDELAADVGEITVSVPETPYVVGVTETSVAVGYGSTDRTAAARADAALRRGPSRPERIPAALAGDAVAYATLGDRTRSHLLDRADREYDGILRAAEAFGVALDVGGDRSGIEYGVAADPGSLSAEDLWELASRAAEPESSIDVGSVSRRGRLFVLEATVGTDDLWPAHERLFGSLSAV